MDFYGTRQLTYMMKSLFYEQELLNSKMQIKDFVHTESEKSTSSKEQHWEEVMIRAQTAYTYKEFYKQVLSELHYEVKMH